MLIVKFSRLYKCITGADANTIFGELADNSWTEEEITVGLNGETMHLSKLCSRFWKDDITDLQVVFHNGNGCVQGSVVELIDCRQRRNLKKEAEKA